MSITNNATYSKFPNISKRLTALLSAISVLSLLIALSAAVSGPQGTSSLTHAWLIACMVIISIGLGGLFLLAIQYVTGSKWSISTRRIVESLSLIVIPGSLGLLPIIVTLWAGDHSLFEWNNTKHLAEDPLLAHKSPYLNVPFFTVRTLFYATVWISLARMYWRFSIQQDSTSEISLTSRLEGRSAGALILLGLTTTFASFDWLMSISPHWFSTIFGIYLFSSSLVAVLSITTIIACRLHIQPAWSKLISENHLHDLGKLLFGFNCFWAYIAFSQYLLIWYANIPEETFWYKDRLNHGWEYLALALIFVHFVIPFLFLMSRTAKRNAMILAAGALLIFCGHLIDIAWLVAPQFEPISQFGVTELFSLISMSSLSVLYVLRSIQGQSMVPKHDPRLERSIQWATEPSH